MIFLRFFAQRKNYFLPQARVFVFGSGTNDFIRNVFGTEALGLSGEANPSCFSISMCKTSAGQVVTDNVQSFTYLQVSLVLFELLIHVHVIHF